MYIMILSIMYYFTNFGDLCDSGSFHLYGFPGSTTHYDKKFILLLLTSFISEIKLFLFLNYSYLGLLFLLAGYLMLSGSHPDVFHIPGLHLHVSLIHTLIRSYFCKEPPRNANLLCSKMNALK